MLTIIITALLAFATGYFFHNLKTDEERLLHRARKYEELVELLYAARVHVDANAEWWVYDQQRALSEGYGTMPKALAIARLYFPEMVGPLLTYAAASSTFLTEVADVCRETSMDLARIEALKPPRERHSRAFMAVDQAVDGLGDRLFGESRQLLESRFTARLNRALTAFQHQNPYR